MLSNVHDTLTHSHTRTHTHAHTHTHGATSSFEIVLQITRRFLVLVGLLFGLVYYMVECGSGRVRTRPKRYCYIKIVRLGSVVIIKELNIIK